MRHGIPDHRFNQPGQASLLIFKPDTLLDSHRQGFRLFWKFRSRHHGGRPKLATETIALLQQMAQENRLWVAERPRGELLKLGFRVAKHTIQTYITQVRPAKFPSQTWAIFLKNHAQDIWACDFLPVIDLWFRPLDLFFISELASRQVGHFNVTAHPTDAWVAQQPREATPFSQAPRFLIRDRDSKHGETFSQVAVGTSIEILKTPYRAPKANAICERFLGSVRRRAGVLESPPGFGRPAFASGDPGIRDALQLGETAPGNRATDSRRNFISSGGTGERSDYRVSGTEWVAS